MTLDVCEHGGLRRKCETCEAVSENARLLDALNKIRVVAGRAWSADEGVEVFGDIAGMAEKALRTDETVEFPGPEYEEQAQRPFAVGDTVRLKRAGMADLIEHVEAREDVL